MSEERERILKMLEDGRITADQAARLIEAAGLKGARLGGAQVSEKHANFIVNDDNASAADIEALLLRVQAEVMRVHGVRLETEVRIVGEATAGADRHE